MTMKWLKFIEELNKLGIYTYTTSIQNQEKTYDISSISKNYFGETKIVIKNLEVKYKDDRKHKDPLPEFIKYVLDIDKWKYSCDIDINNDNIEEIKQIIQNKILNRAKEIEKMMILLAILNKTNSIHQ